MITAVVTLADDRLKIGHVVKHHVVTSCIDPVVLNC